MTIHELSIAKELRNKAYKSYNYFVICHILLNTKFRIIINTFDK